MGRPPPLIVHDPGSTITGPAHTTSTGCGAAWLARRSGGPKVPGSSPGSPTPKRAGRRAARRFWAPAAWQANRLLQTECKREAPWSGDGSVSVGVQQPLTLPRSMRAFPHGLTGSVIEWLLDAFYGRSDALGRRPVLQRRVREMEVRFQLTLGAGTPEQLLRRLLDLLAKNDSLLLGALDVALEWCPDPPKTQAELQRPAALMKALSQGQSAWQVAYLGESGFGLERCVDATVTTAAEDTISIAGRAGQHLAAAWAKAYRRPLSSSESYREAVRAVEVAAIPIVVPEDPKATLGKIIGAIRDAPQKWNFVLSPSDGVIAVGVVRQMLELLWKSQLDRHGTTDETMPLEVSIEEARAAVHLATTLVQWFASGAVERT